MDTLNNRDCNAENSMVNETFAQLPPARTHLIAPSIFIYERPSPSRPITHWVSSQKGVTHPGGVTPRAATTVTGCSSDRCQVTAGDSLGDSLGDMGGHQPGCS